MQQRAARLGGAPGEQQRQGDEAGMSRASHLLLLFFVPSLAMYLNYAALAQSGHGIISYDASTKCSCLISMRVARSRYTNLLLGPRLFVSYQVMDSDAPVLSRCLSQPQSIRRWQAERACFCSR